MLQHFADVAQVSYHTHIPEYIPKYTWKGLVGPMWRVIRFNILMADLTLVPSKTMKARSTLAINTTSAGSARSLSVRTLPAADRPLHAVSFCIAVDTASSY